MLSLKERLDKRFFPFVIKPGRYAGGEPGEIVKNPEARVSYLHAFPDKYELGQSYLGLQTLYHVVNQDDRFLCERVFAVDHDAEEIMRREAIPLFSLESRRAAKEFDAIGFTLPYELVFTNVLTMLDLAQVPLLARDRRDGDPLIMAGGPAVYNPEPMAEFIDLFFVGDAEEGLPELLSVLHEYPNASRTEKLELLCRGVESVYVPVFYDEERRPLYDFAPPKIKARVVPQLKAEYYPEKPIVPVIDTVHNHLAIEIMRGCPQGCRFCQAGPMYRPVRHRPKNDILHQIETQLTHTGYEEITLLSLSSSDYPDIDDLASTIARRFEKQRVSISLPSLRPGTISPRLLDAVKKVRKGGLTISPEAGTERLRLFIRKDFPDAAIYDTVTLAFERGWTTIKLYFMLGLPTETEEDVRGIADMIMNISAISQRYPGRKTINVTLSPFLPKPHTPFQWDEIVAPEIILERIQFIKRNCRSNQVNFKYNLTESTLLQGLLSRGGREMGPVIAAAYEKGCRFDGWSEECQYNTWIRALTDNGIDMKSKMKPLPFDANLPWSHIEKGGSSEHLQEERQRTSFQLRDYVPPPRTEDESFNGDAVTEYGRGKRRVAVKNQVAPTKNCVRLRWGKGERYRFMSHLDNLRTIERAVRRASLPVSYSQGYNPTMKLSFGPPLPLGFTSEAEFVDITLDTTVMPYMIESLRRAMPEGMIIHEYKTVLSKTPSLSAALNRVTYRLSLNGYADRARLPEQIDRLLALKSLEVAREGKTESTTVDIRPAIYDLKESGNQLTMTLGIGVGGYARPSEVIEALLGDNYEKHLLNSIHRVEAFKISDIGEKIPAMDL